MKVTIVVYHSTFARWLSGVTTLAVIAGMSVANHRFGGGTAWIDMLAVICGFLSLVGMATRTTSTSFSGTKQEAIDYLNKFH